MISLFYTQNLVPLLLGESLTSRFEIRKYSFDGPIFLALDRDMHTPVY